VKKLAEEKKTEKKAQSKSSLKKAAPLVGGGLIVLVLAFGAWYSLGRGDSELLPAMEVGDEAAVESVEDDPGTLYGSLKEALARRVPMKCLYEDAQGNSSVGYLKGEKYYGEITSAAGTGFIIVKDNCIWSWTKDEDKGFKMCFDPMEGEAAGEGEASIWDNEALYQDELNCSPAVVADSQFDPPVEVEFFGFEELGNLFETRDF
jgi:hypothetical protein